MKSAVERRKQSLYLEYFIESDRLQAASTKIVQDNGEIAENTNGAPS